jgi:hypothetical protein
LGTGDDPDDAIAAAQELDPADPAAGGLLQPTAWVREGFALAKSQVYSWPVKNGTGPYHLTSGYIDRAEETAAAQAALAGLRLANLLDQIIH